MTSEESDVSEHHHLPALQECPTSHQGELKSTELDDIEETRHGSVRGRIAKFEEIGSTESGTYNFSQKRAHKELSHFKIDSIRRNFNTDSNSTLPCIRKQLHEEKARKISDSSLSRKRAIFDPFVINHEKSASNEEISMKHSSEDVRTYGDNSDVLLPKQNDKNSVSQTTITSLCVNIQEDTEIQDLREASDGDIQNKYTAGDKPLDHRLIEQYSIVLDKSDSHQNPSKPNNRDPQTIQDIDFNISKLNTESYSTDGTYVSISIPVRSQLLAQNRHSDASSGDYKCAVPPTTESVYDRALTDRDSSSSSNFAILRKPTIVNKHLKRHKEKLTRPSSWHLGTIGSEHNPVRLMKRDRRHSLSTGSVKGRIINKERIVISQPVVVSASMLDQPSNDSWSGNSSSDFNNELNFSTSDSSRSHIYDADEDESDPYDRPHQMQHEDPYDTPSPNRPRSETANTITQPHDQARVHESSSKNQGVRSVHRQSEAEPTAQSEPAFSSGVSEIPENADTGNMRIYQQRSPFPTMLPENLTPPEPPARKSKTSDEVNSADSVEGKVISQSSAAQDPDARRAVHISGVRSTKEDDRIRKLSDNRHDRPQKSHQTRAQRDSNAKGSTRSRKLSLAPAPNTEVFENHQENQSRMNAKPKPKYKKFMNQIKRSMSLHHLYIKETDSEGTDFGSSTSCDNLSQSSLPTRSSRGIGKIFSRFVKRH